MNTSELLKKVRQIEIKTKQLSNHIFAGEYHTAFKGKGMAFSEVREYQAGDDIRLIDWNVTARYNNPYIKVFEEEREMTVMLLIDVSASGSFGTKKQFKRELATEIAAILAFSAIKNNDKVGVIFFSNIVEHFIPPKKGKSHILRIISEVLSFKAKEKKTDIAVALEYFNSVIKKKSVCFILSDFISKSFKKPLQIANKKHDIIGLNIYDQREKNMPNIGLLPIQDAENGEIILLDTTNKKIREEYNKDKNLQIKEVHNILSSIGIDLINLNTGENYVIPLMNFFKSRHKRK
tara:strand:+ start:472 stop:1347 length:876 start_codon:yes stop_codon:yes gene_type:complete